MQGICIERHVCVSVKNGNVKVHSVVQNIVYSIVDFLES